MNIEEVKAELKITPGNCYVAVQFDYGSQHFGAYFMEGSEDEPESTSLTYEGGKLFESGGEEEYYDTDNLPKELLSLNFKPIDEPIYGYQSHYLAHKLFPTLPNPEHLYTKKEHQEFIFKLANIIKSL